MDNRTIEQIRKNETKLINEIKLLEQSLNEIKEYIKDKQKIQYKFALSQIECSDILQIIDKVLGEDNEVSK